MFAGGACTKKNECVTYDIKQPSQICLIFFSSFYALFANKFINQIKTYFIKMMSYADKVHGDNREEQKRQIIYKYIKLDNMILF